MLTLAEVKALSNDDYIKYFHSILKEGEALTCVLVENGVKGLLIYIKNWTEEGIDYPLLFATDVSHNYTWDICWDPSDEDYDDDVDERISIQQHTTYQYKYGEYHNVTEQRFCFTKLNNKLLLLL